MHSMWPKREHISGFLRVSRTQQQQQTGHSCDRCKATRLSLVFDQTRSPRAAADVCPSIYRVVHSQDDIVRRRWRTDSRCCWRQRRKWMNEYVSLSAVHATALQRRRRLASLQMKFSSAPAGRRPSSEIRAELIKCSERQTTTKTTAPSAARREETLQQEWERHRLNSILSTIYSSVYYTATTIDWSWMTQTNTSSSQTLKTQSNSKIKKRQRLIIHGLMKLKRCISRTLKKYRNMPRPIYM